MEPDRQPGDGAVVELCLAADDGHLALVRAVAMEVCAHEPASADLVRSTTHTLACSMLAYTSTRTRLRCRFHLRDRDICIQVAVPDPAVYTPEAKARNAALLAELDDLTGAMRTMHSDTHGTELVYEVVVPRANDEPVADA